MLTNTVYTADAIRSMFDALPYPVFVVDGDVMVHDYNSAAAEFFIHRKDDGLGYSVQTYLPPAETSSGCWRTLFCRDAFIGKSVKEALAGRRVLQRSTRRLYPHQEGYWVEQEALITCSPFHDGTGTHVLLIFEKMHQADDREGVIRICSSCHQIIDEKETLTRIEAYAKKYMGVWFSHGLCPTCFQKEMAKVEAYAFEKSSNRLIGNKSPFVA